MQIQSGQAVPLKQMADENKTTNYKSLFLNILLALRVLYLEIPSPMSTLYF